MIEVSKKNIKIILTVLMLVLLLIAIIMYVLKYEGHYKQKLNFGDTTYNKIHLISEEVAEILDTNVTALNIVNSAQIEINPDSSISYLSINFYVDKSKKEYQLKFMNNSYYVTYIGDHKLDDINTILLNDLLNSVKHIEIEGEKTRIIMSNELVMSIRLKNNQEQYLVDNKGIYLITDDIEGKFMNIKRIQFLDEMWKVNEGIDFFLSINKN